MQQFLFVAGHLALDFVNTTIASDGETLDLLVDFAALADWFSVAGVASPAETAELRKLIGKPKGSRLLRDAKALRAAISGLANSLAAGRSLSPSAIAVLNRNLGQLNERAQLARSGGRYSVVSTTGNFAPQHVLARLARSAADLLASADSVHVRACGNPQCILYFLDTTRNHTRNWCRMAGCGNRMKVAKFRERRAQS